MAIQRSFPRQQGLSLVELMVAVTIGLMLLAGLLSVVANSSKSYGELNETSRQLENGRYALDLLRDQLQHAGYYGGLYTPPSPPASLADPCPATITQTVLEESLGLPIQGYDAPSDASSLNCLANADHVSGTDILVIRRASTQAATLGALTPNQFYLQGMGWDFVLEKENTTQTVADDESIFDIPWRDGGSPATAPVFPYETHIYFVSPCSTPSATNCDATADGGNPIPTLKRWILDVDAGGATWTLEPLVEGIEDLQIDYGVDSDDDGAPDSYVTDPDDGINTGERWSNVTTARVNLLARNIERTGGHNDTKTYTLGLTSVGPKNDAYKRHVYSAVVRVTNPSIRRER